MTPTPTDWPALLRLSALSLGVPPAAFWALSLREWRALVARPADAVPLSGAALAALLTLYPDEPA